SRRIESGPSADRRPSSPSRSGSPRAANTGAASGSLSAAARLGDILRELLRLARPPRVVHAERLGAARERDAIEARFHDRDRGAFPAVDLFETELDQRGGLRRVVDLGIDRVGVPAIREVL